MQLKDTKWVLIKGVIFVAWFSFFHYLYELFYYLWEISGWSINPFIFLGVFGATDESVLSHMKIAFWGYLCTILVEHAIFRKTVDIEKDYFVTRLLTVALIPWTEFIFWYLGPLFFENLGPVWVEVLYSIIVVFLMGIWTGFFEINIEFNYKKAGKILILVYFITTVIILSGFSYVKPYIDVFYGIYVP